MSEPRVIIVGDIHISDRPPSSCTDTYLEDIFEMLRYVAGLEKALKADAVVWAGDIFHHKQPSRTSHKTVLRTIEIANLYTRLLVTVGNHDILNDRVSSIYESQPFGVLLESGVGLLDGWDTEGLPLFGVQWQQRWTDPETPRAAFVGWRHDDPRKGEKDKAHSLVVTHAPIYPLGQELEFEFVPTAGPNGISAAMDNTGYIYYGHIHEPHGIFEVEGVQYANHGAISRGSLHEYNLKRDIAVTLWTPSDGFTKIPIPHKPAEEVFRLQEAAIAQDKALDLAGFLLSVGSTRLEITSIEAVAEHLRQLDVDDEVKQLAIQILQETA